MSLTPSKDTPPNQQRRLRYQDELTPVMDVITKEYHSFNGLVYRTVCHLPASAFDITPQSKREELSNQGQAIDASLDDQMATSLENANIKEKREYISNHALSVFQTPEQLKQDTLKTYRRIVKRYGVEEADAYITERRGKYICRINVNDKGIISDFSKTSGHANLLIYEGITEDDLYDTSFEPITIDSKDEPKNLDSNARP